MCLLRFLHKFHGLSHKLQLVTFLLLYKFQGEFSVALPLLEKAVKLYILNLGETHPIVASAIHNLEVAFEKVEHEH